MLSEVYNWLYQSLNNRETNLKCLPIVDFSRSILVRKILSINITLIFKSGITNWRILIEPGHVETNGAHFRKAESISYIISLVWMLYDQNKKLQINIRFG